MDGGSVAGSGVPVEKAIEAVIERYEPRLRGARVHRSAGDSGPFTLVFDVTGSIDLVSDGRSLGSRRVRLHAELPSHRPAVVRG